MKQKRLTQTDMLMEYFRQNPGRDIPHPEIVDWAVKEWQQRTGTVFRDPDRGIRGLSDKGMLVKVSKGVYRYDPNMSVKWEKQQFTAEQKEVIKKRDGYRCRFCGLGTSDGAEIQVDHILSPQKGGKAEISNGQTLCARHNYMKRKLGVLESGKRFFMELYRTAQANNDKDTFDFCREILDVYERHNINGHIKWDR